MVEEVKKLKMKIVDFNKKQVKERIEKIKVETEKRIAEGNVQNRLCDQVKLSTVKSPYWECVINPKLVLVIEIQIESQFLPI